MRKLPTREEKALLTRIQRASKALEEAQEYLDAMMAEEEEDEESNAEYDADEKGFFCLSGRKKSCKELVFEAGEMVVHLRDEHGIEPEDQEIDGWTARHEKKAKAYLDELEAEDEEEGYTKAELDAMSKAELKEILDEWKIKYKSKDTKKALAKQIFTIQSEPEEEEDEEEEEEEPDEGQEYTAEELDGMNTKGLKEILDEWKIKYKSRAKKTDLVSAILDAQAEEEDEEEEEEEFVPYKLASKKVKAFAKEHDLEKDEVKLVVDYANEEEVTLAEAAEEFELVDEEDEEED